MSERPATWDCPACGTPNTPGTDSCRVCGRHLHVDESTGVAPRVLKTGPKEFAWGLGGLAAPPAGVGVGLLVAEFTHGLVGVLAGLVVQVVGLIPASRGDHDAFVVGWWISVALTVLAAVLVATIWLLGLSLAYSPG